MNNKKTKICMNSMVGNEAATIKRMLESTAPHIDYWVIQCNGNDDTLNIINEFFKEKNIPGFTYHIDWNYPGWNRDHTLQTCLKADHGCDWILRMDADEMLHVDENFDWSILDDTSVQSYNICAQNEGLKYFRTWFWNAKLPWFFAHDKRHETIHLPEIGEDFQRENMPIGFKHLVSQDGNTWLAPRKFLRDALELEIDKVVGYKVLEDTYHLWYLAKSYSDCYGNPDELPFGRKHSEEYARRSIWYFERYFEARHNIDIFSIEEPKILDEMAYFALILMGQAYDFIGDEEKSILCFEKAIFICPVRNEHLVHFLTLLENKNKLEEMMPIFDFLLRPERVNPFPNLAFLIEDNAYYNTSNFLVEWKEKIKNKITEPTINMDSFNFEFN